MPRSSSRSTKNRSYLGTAVKSAIIKGANKYISATNKLAGKIKKVVGSPAPKKSSRSKKPR